MSLTARSVLVNVVHSLEFLSFAKVGEVSACKQQVYVFARACGPQFSQDFALPRVCHTRFKHHDATNRCWRPATFLLKGNIFLCNHAALFCECQPSFSNVLPSILNPKPPKKLLQLCTLQPNHVTTNQLRALYGLTLTQSFHEPKLANILLNRWSRELFWCDPDCVVEMVTIANYKVGVRMKMENRDVCWILLYFCGSFFCISC